MLSLKDYGAAAIRLWVGIALFYVFSVVSVVMAMTGTTSLPSWCWWVAAMVAQSIAQFLPFRAEWEKRRVLEARLSGDVPVTIDSVSNPIGPQQAASYFVGLVVRNPNGQPIADCYGELVAYRQLFVPQQRHEPPPTGFLFRWSNAQVPGCPTEATIPGKASRVLDLAVARGDTDWFGTPVPCQAAGVERPLGPGMYLIVVDVGPKAADLRTCAYICVEFKGEDDLRGWQVTKDEGARLLESGVGDGDG